jgi:hypothetical protein
MCSRCKECHRRQNCQRPPTASFHELHLKRGSPSNLRVILLNRPFRPSTVGRGIRSM